MSSVRISRHLLIDNFIKFRILRSTMGTMLLVSVPEHDHAERLGEQLSRLNPAGIVIRLKRLPELNWYETGSFPRLNRFSYVIGFFDTHVLTAELAPAVSKRPVFLFHAGDEHNPFRADATLIPVNLTDHIEVGGFLTALATMATQVFTNIALVKQRIVERFAKTLSSWTRPA